jgi:hypothetical protein
MVEKKSKPTMVENGSRGSAAVEVYTGSMCKVMEQIPMTLLQQERYLRDPYPGTIIGLKLACANRFVVQMKGPVNE